MAFSFDSRIRYSEVDSSCRLSLTGLTNYFQDCSVFHSQSHDVGIRFLADNHIAWVLSSWQICINRLPLLNEQVKISTWAIWYEGVLRFTEISRLKIQAAAHWHMPILSGCLLIHEPADR